MRAIILAVGDELVLGQTVDTNSAWLSGRLAELGIMTQSHLTVADDRTAIAAAIRQACASADLVIISGGLGPTDDDLTRAGLAEAMGVDLVLHEPSVTAIREFFAQRGREMPDRNRVQAFHPRNTQVIPNLWGTAPAITGTLDRARFFVLPGVPREMIALFEHALVPVLAQELRKRGPTPFSILTSKVNTFGVGESDVADMLGDLMRRDRNPLVGTTVSGGVVSVRIRSEFSNPEEARRQLEDTLARVEQALGPIAYGRDDQSLAAATLDLLRSRHATVATAESCTGGLLGSLITAIPGSSEAYLGGWVVYSNTMKRQELGVASQVLSQHGAVSEATARALASGARERAEADYALAITGVAGPGGGTSDKPVGTVWIALAEHDVTYAMRFLLGGDREVIRHRSALAALQMLRLRLLKQPLNLIRWGTLIENPQPSAAPGSKQPI